ncbi:alpha-amylase family protein [Paenibacillus daejeonensis]|uniref:alpha-amylase family protein n=1 Tax=Paenibacillus daejeonensis TaxID=135193 RepID=UPI0003663C30|nr:alpha-amylase family protein [Paenibacillus daejeonensis]
MSNSLWWHEPLRIIQPNMQVKDTHRIDPPKLARQLKEMGANTIVFNVGGIYAWYPSKVPHHHVNEYLPAQNQGDLLQEMITELHKEGLRFVARYDFSKADDAVYYQRPDWFVREAGGEPQIIGAKRPGNWSLLMATCINTGYRNEELAVPVLEESLSAYYIDGVFFNNPGTIFCRCERCREGYQALYDKPLPEQRSEVERAWFSVCLRRNMELLQGTVKRVRPEAPVLGYYNLFNERLEDRKAGSDLLCTEPQNVLSLGHQRIPEFWKPALSVKLGRSRSASAPPLGIVHSCPGMDWRHTGLPPAEYAFWLAQVPAYGGQIWHSLTGVPDTIRDKRILRIVTEHNRREAIVAEPMRGAEPLADTALLWGSGRAVEGWADGLVNRQIPFDLLTDDQDSAALDRYRALIVPAGHSADSAAIARWRGYAERGGLLIVEGRLQGEGAAELLGIEPLVTMSEPLHASYLRFEGTDNPLQRGMEETELIAFGGVVAYCKLLPGAKALATLVPPFSPPESVGAPPERASLPVERTDLPLAVHHPLGQGGVLYLPFAFSELLDEYRLGEHYRLLDNLLDLGDPQRKLLSVTRIIGLQASLYRNGSGVMLHVVNGTGRRPLSEAVPLHGIEVRLPRRLVPAAPSAVGLLENGPLELWTEGEDLVITLPRLEVWEAVQVDSEQKLTGGSR